MFFIEQKGIKIQDIIHSSDQFCTLLGLDAPYYIILCKRNTNTVNGIIFIHFIEIKIHVYITENPC